MRYTLLFSLLWLIITCKIPPARPKTERIVTIEELKSKQIIDSVWVDSLAKISKKDSIYSTTFAPREILPGDQYDIGRGYNTVNNEVTGKVVEYTDGRDLKTVSDQEAQRTDYDLQVIKTYSQL